MKAEDAGFLTENEFIAKGPKKDTSLSRSRCAFKSQWNLVNYEHIEIKIEIAFNFLNERLIDPINFTVVDWFL